MEKKGSELAILDILANETDADHPMTMPVLLERMKEKYDLALDRRTIYLGIDILNRYGYTISDYSQNRGYYYTGRKFDKGEILMLCNAIHASHFVTEKESTKLIRKLLKTQSRHTEREYLNTVYMPNRKKTENAELFPSIEKISSAIREGHPVAFRYLRRNAKKELTDRSGKEYIVFPRYIVYSDARGYLIANDAKHTGFAHYRLDRMSKVRILPEKMPPLPQDCDPYEYAANKLFMYTGPMVSAILRCDLFILDAMIDIFGKEVKAQIGTDHFDMYVTASEQGLLFLAQQYMDYIEILEPQDLREKMRDKLRGRLEQYEK